MTFYRQQTSTNQQGAITLILALVLFVVITLIIIASAQQARTRTLISSNTYRMAQAVTAANAGLQYGIVYFQNNRSTIISSPVLGFINYTDSNITNVALANNSTYSISYSNPTIFNYNLILITAIGKSDDGIAQRTVRMLINYDYPTNANIPSSLLTTGWSYLDNNARAVNLEGLRSIISGSTITIRNSATTLGLGGWSTASSLGGDVVQNMPTYSSMSSSTLQTTIMNALMSEFQPLAQASYSFSNDHNYNSELSGMAGKVVYIQQTNNSWATINSGSTFGTSANPITIIVDGKLLVDANATVYGNVFATGNINMNSNAKVYGLVFSLETVNLDNSDNITGAIVAKNIVMNASNIVVTYNSTNINNALQRLGRVIIVPGSWRDF